MLASAAGYAETAKALLDSGADINITNEEERTALMLAARGGFHRLIPDRGCGPNLVGLLIESGADAEARDELGMTLLIWAIVGGNTDIVLFMLDEDLAARKMEYPEEADLIEASVKGKTDAVLALLDRGTTADAETSDGLPGLAIAAGLGHTEVVSAL